MQAVKMTAAALSVPHDLKVSEAAAAA